MPASNIAMSIAYLLTEAISSGLTIQQVLKDAEATGVIPQEHWDKLKQDFDDANQFWSSE